jgi:hypothetical protein
MKLPSKSRSREATSQDHRDEDASYFLPNTWFKHFAPNRSTGIVTGFRAEG